MSQITRTQFRNALYTTLTDQQTATPTELRRVLRYRPGGMGAEKPVAWVGQVVEALAYDSGTRFRTLAAEVICATTFPSDLITTADPFDQLLDALVERFTNNATVIPSTITELSAIDDGEVSFVGAGGETSVYRGATLTIQLRIWEGRT